MHFAILNSVLQQLIPWLSLARVERAFYSDQHVGSAALPARCWKGLCKPSYHPKAFRLHVCVHV